MNVWQQIEQDFLLRFPQGLDDEAWLALGKKHRSVAKVIALAQEGLQAEVMQAAIASGNIAAVIETCRQMVAKCTTVSTFERIAFRNYLSYSDVHIPFVLALHDVLHRFDAASFTAFVETLQLCRHDGNANAAKWPLLTCFLAYSDPQRHVCIKPTTVRKLAARLEVDIAYQAQPNYETYRRVQDMVAAFKAQSQLAAGQNNIITQAIMYCTV